MLLSKYFCDTSITKEKKIKMMREIDDDNNGEIDSEEFYKWMVLNAENDRAKDSSGTKTLSRREERLEIANTGKGIPQDLKDFLEELGVGAVVQK